MRITILANSLPAALSVYDEAKNVKGNDVFILLFPAGEGVQGIAKHLARLILKSERLRSLQLIARGKVKFFRRPLDHPEELSRLKSLNPDIGLHKSGTIYREPTINCFRLGILNAHIGILPRYRGRSVMEWSLVEGSPVGVTVFFIDAGIDTGERIVLSEEVDISRCKTIVEAKQYLFNLDATFYRRALELLTFGDLTYQKNDVSGPRYYVMSRLFQDVAEECLVEGNRQ